MLTNALAAVDKDLFLFVLKASLQYDITRTDTATDNRSMENSNATKALTSRQETTSEPYFTSAFLSRPQVLIMVETFSKSSVFSSV